ncbi:uncharacterized protein F5147DRAFT_748530 [Suillus discolor]|uniref:Protein kinase domain-containing protein n=1 Tax=Suillus discolor TaxID=1912936 RepID=A0A9P7JLG7_9AGAM|nr:uncharacterized protein F5147DRAFT_748530 [Suillus discolor]KAG2087361.1 hypothetical protein F5147DRAFT_748530 [Suillus discolor]
MLDARRTQDGARVSLKCIDIEIGRFFSSLPLIQDPANHCVPIYACGHPLTIILTSIHNDMSKDFKSVARHCARMQSPPRYHYIDFGISRKYDASWKPPYMFVEDYTKPWNPFPTDIWSWVYMPSKTFFNVSVYSGVEFLTGLVSDMMHSDPAQRPNMDDIFSRLQILRQVLRKLKLRSQVAHNGEISL